MKLTETTAEDMLASEFLNINDSKGFHCLLDTDRSRFKMINIVNSTHNSHQIVRPRGPVTACIFLTSKSDLPFALVKAMERVIWYCIISCYDRIHLFFLSIFFSWTSWGLQCSPFCRWYFQLHFLILNMRYLDWNFQLTFFPNVLLKICHHWFKWWLDV